MSHDSGSNTKAVQTRNQLLRKDNVQDGDHIVWMSPDPTCDICEVGLNRAGIEKITGSMAAGQGTCGSVIMRLYLKHSYAVIELIDDS